MAYFTIAEWGSMGYHSGELIQLAGDENGDPDEAIFAAAEEQARGVIDSYLSMRYSVPLSEVPAPIKVITADLTRWYLHKQGVPEDVVIRKDDALRMLRDYGRGAIVLSGAIAAATTYGTSHTTVSSVFAVDPGPLEFQ